MTYFIQDLVNFLDKLSQNRKSIPALRALLDAAEAMPVDPPAVEPSSDLKVPDDVTA